jgi:DinB superfamily
LSTTATPDTKLALLRHAVATLAYRGGKPLRGCPEGFADFRAAPGTRSPAEILAHLGDLLEWAASQVQGKSTWRTAPPLPWEQEKARFFAALAGLDGALDAELAGGAPAAFSAERLFQGPIADAFTHVGQLALLRRLAGAPVRGENFVRADIVAGRVSAEQSSPALEFD